MSEILGTLLPLTALDSQRGKGDLFDVGFEFVDWLAETGQNAWQLLPLHQTSWENDNLFAYPYSGFGVGLNPMLGKNSGVQKFRSSEIDEFREENRDWVEDYGLFLALADEFETDFWPAWPEKIRDREEVEIERWRKKLGENVDFYVNQQAMLYDGYIKFKKYSKDKGIRIIGDMPFYLDLKSPLVWINQECFQIEKSGDMEFVSGCLPGRVFGRQIWNHPLYEWKGNLEKIIGLFELRLRFCGLIYDQFRIDHAVGFYHYGAMNLMDSRKDMLMEGPGDKALEPLIKFCESRKIRILVEDLGDVDQTDLHSLMDKYTVPGLTLLPMELVDKDGFLNEEIWKESFLRGNHFYYSSNHDTETLLGLVDGMSMEVKRSLIKKLSLPDETESKVLAKNILDWMVKNCRYLIVPIQDWLGLKERINVPGDVTRRDMNWKFQLQVKVEELPNV